MQDTSKRDSTEEKNSILPNITQLTMIRGGHDILGDDENATDVTDIYKRHGTGERGDDDEEMPSHSKSNESRNKSMTSKSCKSLNSRRAATSLYIIPNNLWRSVETSYHSLSW